MMRERHFLFGRWAAPQRRMVLAVSLLLCSGYLLAAGQSAGGRSEQVAHKFVPLNHIPAEQGRKYLEDLKLCTASKMPGTNTLLVTGQPQELVKATTILKVVDVKERFVIRAIFPALAAERLPTNKQIAAAIGDISIGDFSNPPPHGQASAQAIIDTHNGAVLAIAPASQVEKIVSAIESAMGGQRAGIQKAQQMHDIYLIRQI